MDVTLLSTGIANVASVSAALARLGVRAAPSVDPETCRTADAVVLPGVGSFAAGMAALNRHGLGTALKARIEEGRPTLAICLGLQLLSESSDESAGTPGLGVLPVQTVRLDGAPRLPHFGWNRIESAATEGLVQGGSAYFAHTYCLRPSGRLEEAGWRVATSVEGAPFVAAVERGAVVAAQFHPELSSTYGRDLITRWLERARAQSAVDTTQGATPCR